MMAGIRWLTAFQNCFAMVLVVNTVYGLLKAFSNGVFSKVAMTCNAGGGRCRDRGETVSAKSKAYKPPGIC